MAPRPHKLSIRLSEQEFAMFQAVAEVHQRKLSAIIRESALAGLSGLAIDLHQPADFQRRLRGLAKILKQIQADSAI